MMKASRNRDRRGFTLVEMTIAMVLSLLIASGCLMVMQSHTSFMKEMRSFRFLREDAPQVNSLVTQLVSKAVAYRIHATPADAFAGIGPVNTGGKAVKLMFRNPSGLVDQSVIAFELVGGEPQLNYYRFRNGSWPGSADWTITSRLADVQFSDNVGVLMLNLIGPANEEITYAGTTQ